MKKLIFILAILSSLNAIGQEDFVIRLNDTLINIALDKAYNINVKGSNLKFTVSSKDTLTYNAPTFSFQYPKAYKVSSTKIDEGVEQITIMTAEGSGMLIQSYGTMNPTSLIDLMLTEMTKESINYGFESKRSIYRRKLKSGQEIEVTKAVLNYKKEVKIYEVASMGKKDAGLMIITIITDNDQSTEGLKVIDLMWQSLMVK